MMPANKKGAGARRPLSASDWVAPLFGGLRERRDGDMDAPLRLALIGDVAIDQREDRVVPPEADIARPASTACRAGG